LVYQFHSNLKKSTSTYWLDINFICYLYKKTVDDYLALSQPYLIKEKEDEGFPLRINVTCKEIMRFISTLKIDDDDFWIMTSWFENKFVKQVPLNFSKECQKLK
jgi:hypothetical protein